MQIIFALVNFVGVGPDNEFAITGLPINQALAIAIC